MEELVISTLLKYNEIFDAFSQVFQIHNYNYNQQKQLLEQYLQKEYISSCIYVSVNQNNNYFPQHVELEKIEKKVQEQITQQSQSLPELISETVEFEIKNFKQSLEQILIQHNDKLEDFRSHVGDIYLPKQDIKQFKQNSEERINRLQDQIQQFQTKYALKIYTEQHIIDIKAQLQGLQSTFQSSKQDTQTLHKLNREIRQLHKDTEDKLSKRLIILESNQYKIIEFEREVEKMQNSIINVENGNEQLINKIKALSQLFQELDVNNSKTVQFEIHKIQRIFDEEFTYFKNKQQSFQDQLQVAKELHQQFDSSFHSHQQSINDQFDIISKELVNKNGVIKQIIKNISQLQQAEKMQIQSDLPNRINIIQSKVQYLERHSRSVYDQTKKAIDLLQEFCETSQIYSDTREKDLTNLILLLDRKVIELGKAIYEPQLQVMQSTTMKVNTPRISTSVESPFKTHHFSRQSKAGKYNKVLNQTMICEGRRETVL